MTHRMLGMAFVLLASTTLSSCASSSTPVRSSFFAMNTIMSASVHGLDSEHASTAIKQEIIRLDQLWSATQSDSDIFSLNQQAGSETHILISLETAQLLSHANTISTATAFAFNPILAPVSSLWDFVTNQVPDHVDLSLMLPLTTQLPTIDLVHSTATLLHPNQALDLGAIAKGACSDYLAPICHDYDIDGALVSLGTSSVFAYGLSPDGDPWQLGIKDPKNTSQTLGLFSLLDGQTCSTSGAYQQYFNYDGTLYHHILDPSTGYPSTQDLTSVTLISNDGALTDALSTALYVMGSADAIAFWRDSIYDFDCILVTDSSIYISERLYNDFTPNEKELGYDLQILRR